MNIMYKFNKPLPVFIAFSLFVLSSLFLNWFVVFESTVCDDSEFHNGTILFEKKFLRFYITFLVSSLVNKWILVMVILANLKKIQVTHKNFQLIYESKFYFRILKVKDILGSFDNNEKAWADFNNIITQFRSC